MKRILLTLIALLSLHTVSLAAPTTPDPATNPVLAKLLGTGAKFFYLGSHSNMNGWFVIKDGQVQIVYSTPDNKSALVGAMFGDNGDNLTTTQVSDLVQNNKEVANLIAEAQKEQLAISQAGSPAANTPAPASGAMPSTPLSPGERLIHDLSAASTVVVGVPNSPEILMVMDPHCAHCQATWKALHDVVAKGSVHLRMIPIGSQDTDNERAAAILLGVSDPLNAWDAYVNGDKTTLAGTPSATALAAVRANHAVIDSWKIENTPYLVYRAKDGKVKVVQGEPDKVTTLLTDLGV